ncbi:Bifunctional uridylyltransferase/uridylyl-removing enzyme [Roseimaritima multifibrata]|uniref:Bifunctional uridylyltransferase/uridylyl-removing enzyme n=1 Tax=Roseimaritima multifibrata TaxID=1930274 RepID=A0A517MLW9_9BACT|nr:[protein-PII] uridylyltransferase [Roseimaritima multifibrata]QDS95884.1 Bifunctional uridylyltransferase/uridylyl-removing enzyme [Roseimaritima multifibrata]
MPSPTRPSIRPAVVDARERLKAGRERIRQHHQSGLSGVQVCTSLTDLVDGIVLSLWNATLRSVEDPTPAANSVLVAHGGFGRRDLAPYSDVDLMLVPNPGQQDALLPIVSQFTRDIFDAGLQLGFTVRTQAEANSWAWKDATVFSSLSESRLLSGSIQIYKRYFRSLQKGAIRRQHSLIEAVCEARRIERHKWGETNYLLSPNIKRSRGGLRDIQLIRWIGFASTGETDLIRLVRLAGFPVDDYHRVQAAQQFMLRLRNELHFSYAKNQDILDRAAQLAIAKRWGYVDKDSHLAVEWLMKDYFEHSRNVRYAVAHFRATSERNPLLARSINRIFSKSLDKDIRLGPYEIWVRDSALEEFSQSLSRVLQLMAYANRHQRRIAHKTWQQIRLAMMAQPLETLDYKAGRQFLSLLSHPGHLPSLLRRLHELRVLEKLIPDMRRARGMLEFNQYHKYTVDAHSIRAVEAATQFATEKSLPGDVYREIADKRLLHLALLLHDLGKGYDEDHCIVGQRLALETCPRLGLDEASSKLVAKLIFLHLEMNNTSSQHDLSDPEIVSKFAATVGSRQILDMLLIHSLADMQAVGPEVLTDWKRRLLEELYIRTRKFLDSGNLPGEMDEATTKKKQEVLEILSDFASDATPLTDLEHVLDSLNPLMLQRHDAKTLAEQVSIVAGLAPETSTCWFRPIKDQDSTEFTLVRVDQSKVRGLFALATGTFASNRLEIQHAEVATLAPDIAWDTFVVQNPSHLPKPDAWFAKFGEQLCNNLDQQTVPEFSFPKVWNSGAGESEAVLPLPTRVTFDNDTFEKYTVLSLFAYDRPGLLYAIAKTLADASLLVHFAKISTHLDQVMDVFYITDREGNRILTPEKQQELEDSLIEAAGRSSS